jgi:segregation and condensation protein A
MEANMRKYNYRSNFDEDSKQASNDYKVLLKNITIYDLIKAFKKALMEKPPEFVHQIKMFNVTIDEQMDYISTKIKDHNSIFFYELMADLNEKFKIVVTFIAILEMVKAGRIGLKESLNVNDFVIYGIENG